MLRIVTNITLRLRPALLLFSAESLCWRTNVETRTKETTVSKQGKFGRRLFFVTGLLLINVVVVLAQGGMRSVVSGRLISGRRLGRNLL